MSHMLQNLFEKNKIRFLASGNSLRDLPQLQSREVAFAGRSNCGKSSLINVITGITRLAKCSKSPGKTQLLNLFQLALPQATLIDLPGYGYAKISKKSALELERRIYQYLKEREALKLMVLCLDIRRGFMPSDCSFLEAFEETRRHPQFSQRQLVILANKSDKLNQKEFVAQTRLLERQLASLSLTKTSEGGPILEIFCVSARKKTGIDLVRNLINQTLLPESPEPTLEPEEA